MSNNLPELPIALTDTGYLHLSAELVAQYFASDSIIALPRAGELWLLPVANKASGGLLLKHRNAKGDRSVLIWEFLPEGTPAGLYVARWDDDAKALRLRLEPLGAMDAI